MRFNLTVLNGVVGNISMFRSERLARMIGRPVARLVLLPKCTDPTRGWPPTMPMTMPRKSLNKSFLKISEIRKDHPRLPRYDNCISGIYESSIKFVLFRPYLRTMLWDYFCLIIDYISIFQSFSSYLPGF